jgi:hypothetical protein
MSFALSIVELPLALACPADERMKLPGSWQYILKGCHALMIHDFSCTEQQWAGLLVSLICKHTNHAEST